jgi:hypothetical protein
MCSVIDTDGMVSFESPMINIGRRTTRDVFIASPLFALAKPLNQNSPWSRYSFEPVMAGSELFAGDICFYSDLICSMSLWSARPEFGASWDALSAEKERERHCFHKGLLQEIFKRPPDEIISHPSDARDADITYEFPWGSVSACTDIKSCVGGILVKYAA